MTDDIARDSDTGLARLERELSRDLELLNHPPANWTRPRQESGGARITDVVIIGGGMCGLTAAFALARQGVGNLRVLDARDAGVEGPWVTYARMRTLRSPKHLTGPALGLPRLTFRAWFEAQWGEAEWQALDRIPREQWMDYLRWYRRILAIPVENGVRVTRVRPADHGFILGVDGAAPVHTRKVVLATGREGMARKRIPEPFAPYLGDRCQHSSDDIDFSTLSGKRVVVIGIGASGFDNAACALEAGAAEVRILARAPAMPRVNKAKSIGYPGFTHGFPALPPAQHLAIWGYIARCRVAPPHSAMLRVAGHANLRVSLSSPVLSVESSGDSLVLQTPGEQVTADHVILGTGFHIDPFAAPELTEIAPHVQRWRDLPGLTATHAGEQEYLDFPLLGPSMEFRPRIEEETPWITGVHCFNLAAQLSHGNVSSDIPAVSDGAERLARGICRDLFIADVDRHLADLHAFEDPELLGDEMDLDAWWPPLKP
jgi:cation diffusion facilitator CzcD-associated flavoprotein CzcO